jgi:hypothetical protein
MLIIEIAAGVFLGNIARACFLGYIEYSRKRANYSPESRNIKTVIDNIRMVM